MSLGALCREEGVRLIAVSMFPGMVGARLSRQLPLDLRMGLFWGDQSSQGLVLTLGQTPQSIGLVHLNRFIRL